jgi:hypothetical protein
MSRRWWIVAVLILGACTGGDDSRSTTAPPTSASPATSTPPSAATVAPTSATGEPALPILDDLQPPGWEPATRTEELALAISEEEAPTPQQAIDALALLVEDVPGASPSDLPPGEGLGDGATLRLVDSVRDRLTSEQAAVLEEYLDAGSSVGTVLADGSIEPAGSPGDTAAPPAGTTVEPDGLRRVERTPAVPIDLDYLELLGEVQAAWTAHFPDHPKHDIELRFTPLQGGMDAKLEPDDPSTCVIRVHAGFFQSAPSDDKIRFFFAHELFHCMQSDWYSGYVPPWLDEGSADWAAADLFRGRVLDYDALGVQWFTVADAPLAVRSYSAWPFFENAHLHGRDVYALIESMYESPQTTVSAFLGANQLDGVVFRKDWSTRTLRSSSLAAPWRLAWPVQNDAFGPHDNVFALSARGLGVYNIVGPGRYTQLQLAVDMTPQVGIVAVTPTGGPLTTSTAIGTQTVGEGATGRFCFVPGGCVCPEGSGSNTVPMDGPEMIFSFAASFDGTVAAVRADEWEPERECSAEPEPEQASSNGDPHLLSFDGLPFDVMTLGEFVTARDPDGGFEVQTRHEPVGFGAGTTAVALGAGGHRITFTMPALLAVELPVVRVDGVATTDEELAVGDVQVDIRWPDATVAWPDGTTVDLHWFLGWFVELTVPPERAARLEGLLGSADGDLANDLRLPDGTVVDTSDAALPESPYALAWAVDADTTLFDYEAGQSVGTFRIPHPEPEPIASDQAAIDRCATALGAAAAAYEISSCAYDVSATGEDGFAEEYAMVVDERVREHEPVTIPRPLETAPPTSGGPAAESRTGVPTLTLSGDRPTGTVDAVEGTVLFARTATCDPSADARRVGYLDITVSAGDDQDQSAVGALCDPSGLRGIGADANEWYDGETYIWLPGSGRYEVTLGQTLGEPEAIGNVEIYVDPTPTVLRAADLTGGDRRVLQGIADTVVYLGEPESTFRSEGFDEACAVEAYWGRDEFPGEEPYHLRACTHPTEIRLPRGQLIPVVVFNRTGPEITVAVTPGD